MHLKTQAWTYILTYALTTSPTNKYNIVCTYYVWQARTSFLQLHTELKHVYSKCFAQLKKLNTRTQI